jgi:hypothetical protein
LEWHGNTLRRKSFSVQRGVAEAHASAEARVSEGWLGIRDGIRNWLVTAA